MMTSQDGGWTPERVERLTQLWAEGLSCSMIAFVMGGVTRNAVIGKVHRLKLPGRKVGTSRWYTRPPRPPRTKRTRKAKQTAPARLPRQAEPSIAPEPVEFTASTWQPIPGSKPVTLERVTRCRWCVTDPFAPRGSVDLFCNEPVLEGMSWCAEHKARAFGGGTPSEKAAVRNAKAQIKHEYAEAA